MRNMLRFMMAGATTLLMLASARAADGVDAIKQRGTLNVGVKADYKPFGFRDPTGHVVGIEPDLAADIAKRLGVKLELVQDGMTCILVTHEMNFAREVADHVYFTDRGVIVAHGPPETLFTAAKDERTQRFLSQVL